MFFQIVFLALAQEEEFLPVGLVDGDVGFADHFEDIPLDDDCG